MNFRSLCISILLLSLSIIQSRGQNTDPNATEIITTDLERFWKAMYESGSQANAGILKRMYLIPGSKGIKGFTKGRIKNAEHLAATINSHPKYYYELKASTDSIDGMRQEIIESLVKLKDFYAEAIYPTVYFVVGALNSGGTSTSDGLIIGVDMYGRTSYTDKGELSPWLQSVLSPVNQLPHIVAHELIHFQQNYDGSSLLAASIKEGSADFLAELISGYHINGHVHAFANPKEKELWNEFKERMNRDDYTGWLYGASPDRPNDLGYWMGYQITKAYYDQSTDQKKAVKEILNIKDFARFLEQSNYASKFE
jgi:hypothetical protein